jgi:hypothetical protein
MIERSGPLGHAGISRVRWSAARIRQQEQEALSRRRRQHGPSERARAAAFGAVIQRAFDRIGDFPSVEPPPLPDESVLDQIIAATAQPLA